MSASSTASATRDCDAKMPARADPAGEVVGYSDMLWDWDQKRLINTGPSEMFRQEKDPPDHSGGSVRCVASASWEVAATVPRYTRAAASRCGLYQFERIEALSLRRRPPP